VWAFILLFTVSAGALDPNRRISQYAHTAWRIQDGFFTGTPQAITQTKDGYLWIGTEGGLVRFDGVRFVPWTAPNRQQLPSTRIHSLLGASDGRLWIGTARGLANWNNRDLVNISANPAFIETILQDPKGEVWITRSQVRDDAGPLCEVTGSALRCHGRPDGITFPYAQPLFRDELGNLWLGSSQGVCRWKPGESMTYIDSALARAKGLSGVAAIATGDNGSILVGMRRTGKGLGLQRLLQGAWKDYGISGMDGTMLEVSALLTDRDHGLWIGTQNQGIYRVHDGRADHFGGAEGLSSDAVQGFYEDREGDLWVATSRGIDRFHDTKVISFSIREGLTAEDVDSVLAARDGTVWIGNTQALDVLHQGKLSAIRTWDGLPGRLVTSLFEDNQDRLWVGVDDGLSVYEQGRFRAVNKADGSSLGVVVAITEDVDHNIWAAVTQPALVRIQDLKVQEEITPPGVPRVSSLAADPKSGIWLGMADGNLARYKQSRFEMMPTGLSLKQPIRNLLAESDGSVWAATTSGALFWKDGKAQMLDSHNGLLCDEVYALQKDSRGALWLDAQCGFMMIDAAELQSWWLHPDVKVSVKALDVFDGAQPGLTNFRPEISKSPDGRLWFANENILQMVDPEHLDRNKVPPPVYVEQITADRKKYSVGDKLQLPVRTRDIEIDYTALSLVVPEKVRFRYKLEGHDADWQDPQNRRQAFYSDLPPGNYQFRVIASNNDGVWNEAGAIADFTIPPAFFQTTWFRLCCALATIGILWLLYALRLRRLAASIQTRFAERLGERERIARDLHDTLLQGIFSASIHFDVANNRLPADSPAKSAMQRGLELLKQVSEEGRNALRALRSPQASDDGLEEAISRLPKEFALPEKIDFRVVTQGERRELRPLIRDEVYLIAREAVFNAFRHSQANTIEVEVDYALRNLRILVRDDGCGIDTQVLKTGREGHWGLANMRQRAEKIGGKFEVLSRINGGTEIQLWIPGKLAFEGGPPRGSWFSGLYSPHKERNIETLGEEREK
jgi:signal transduction histidine kinase/ligand-binding sensor domain-containing protein